MKMRYCLVLPLLMCTACSADFWKSADDIATKDAVTFSLSRDAVQKEANIKVNLDMVNTVPAK